MNNESNYNSRSKRLLFIPFALVASVLVLLTVNLLGGSPVREPIQDEELSPEYAQLFNVDEYFNLIDQSDENYALTQKDLATFARTTGEKLRDPSTKIAFTFNDGFTEQDGSYVFTGSFYDLDGMIQLILTKYDKGIIKLSITNKNTNTNIDSSLNLNGKKNELLTQLPINSDYFSIRYLYSEDKIIVAFYEGFTETDVNTVVELLQQVYGEEYDPSLFQFNINAVGTFTLDGVYEYLKNPYSL